MGSFSSGAGSLGDSIGTAEIENGAVTLEKLADAVQDHIVSKGSLLDIPSTVELEVTDASSFANNDSAYDGDLVSGDTFSLVKNTNELIHRVASSSTAGTRRHIAFWNLSQAASRVYFRTGYKTQNMDASGGDKVLLMLSGDSSPTNENNSYRISIKHGATTADFEIIERTAGEVDTSLAAESVDLTQDDTQFVEVYYDDAEDTIIVNRIGNPAGATYPSLMTTSANQLTTASAYGLGFISDGTTSANLDSHWEVPIILRTDA